MKNEYEIRGEVTAIIINSPKYGPHETLIDTEDLDKAKEAECWVLQVSRQGKEVYVGGPVRGKTTYLHRHILGVTDPEIKVDHIYRNTLDNRKKHLRKVTDAENRQNSKIRTDNKSGYPGVHWHKGAKKWNVRIGLNGKRIDLGCYKDLEEAIEVKKKAEKEFFVYKNSIVRK